MSEERDNDNDVSVRAIAAAKLYRMGDDDNVAAAHEIWKEISLSEQEVLDLKESYSQEPKS